MRFRVVSTVAFSAALAFLGACGGGDDKPATEPLPSSGGEVLFPMGPDDRWTYRQMVDEEQRPGAEDHGSVVQGRSGIGRASLRSSGLEIGAGRLPVLIGPRPGRVAAHAGGETELFRSIGATETVGGLSYTAVIDSADGGADTTLYRQDDDELWIHVEFGTSEDPIETMIFDAMRETLPWKFAEFGAASGTAWTIADLDSIFLVEGLPVDVDINLRGRNLGIDAVSVPAGTWEEAQKIEVIQDAGVSVEGFFRIEQNVRFHTWYVDGVGVVREDLDIDFDYNGNTGSVRSTMELTDFDVR
jgi:hypothetical protein